MDKIAILLLNNNGDILYATPVARQIKEIDFPGCHLTWVVSKQCCDVLKNNPYIDELAVIELDSINEIYNGRWKEIKINYLNKLHHGEFQKLFILQPINNFLNYKNSIRQLILDAYPHKIKVPLKAIVRLTNDERAHVNAFIEKHGINNYLHRIIFEFSPNSNQSNITTKDAIQIAERIIEQNEDTCVILSSDIDVDCTNSNIFNAKELTFKENAELINNCDLLIGSSSGISWLSESEYCKNIPTIQLLNYKAPWFNSLKFDFKMNKSLREEIIELYDFNADLILETVHYSFTRTFKSAKEKYDQKFSCKYLMNNFYSISKYLYDKNDFKTLLKFMMKNVNKGLPFLIYNAKLFFHLFKKKIKMNYILLNE